MISFSMESLKVAADAAPLFPLGFQGTNFKSINKSSISDGHLVTNI